MSNMASVFCLAAEVFRFLLFMSGVQWNQKSTIAIEVHCDLATVPRWGSTVPTSPTKIPGPVWPARA